MNPLVWKIGGPLILLAVLVGLGRWGMGWRDKAQAYNKEAAAMVDAVRLATGNPELERAHAVHQIGMLGSSLRAVTAGAEACSASVNKLLDSSARQQLEADRLIGASVRRVQSAESARLRLEASARTGLPGQCLSPEVKKRWK
jgi:hypothetical protein